LFALVFLLTISSHSQTLKADLLLKDGSTISGYGEPTPRNLIKFKTGEKSKKEFFNHEDVDTLKIFYSGVPRLFVFQKVFGRSKPVLLEIIINGKKVVYYRDNTKGYRPSGRNLSPGLNFRKTVTVNLTNSFLRRVEDDEAVHLGVNEWDFQNFAPTSSKYFADCKALVQQINYQKMTKRNLMAIINFYNNSCF